MPNICNRWLHLLCLCSFGEYFKLPELCRPASVRRSKTSSTWQGQNSKNLVELRLIAAPTLSAATPVESVTFNARLSTETPGQSHESSHLRPLSLQICPPPRDFGCLGSSCPGWWPRPWAWGFEMRRRSSFEGGANPPGTLPVLSLVVNPQDRHVGASGRVPTMQRIAQTHQLNC